MSAAPSFTADDLRAVTGEVWEACLAHHGEVLAEGTAAPIEGEVAQALIRIAGDWSGVVTLEMSRETATTAARMLLDAEDVDPDEVADAVGELVNIIGGNVKSLLPTPSRLSLPQVTLVPGVEGLGTQPELPATEHCRVDLSWGAQPILVRVWS